MGEEESMPKLKVALISALVAVAVLLAISAPAAEAVQATASHILVKEKSLCEELKKKIEGGEDFASVAKEHSTCPSAKRGGDLGPFSPGQMVKPFDTVVFNEEVGKVHGPVKTQFGYHLILVKERK